MTTPVTTQLTPARRHVLLGCLAVAVVSLSLPWTEYTGTSSYLLPGFISYDVDGYSTVSPGVLVPGSPGVTLLGTDVAVRVLLPLAVVLVLTGLRRARPALLRLGAAVAASGGVVDGITSSGGRVAYLLAVGVAVLALGPQLFRPRTPPCWRWVPRRTER